MTSVIGGGQEHARIRAVELVAAVAFATDLAKGLPEGQAYRTCRLAVLLARLSGADDRVVRTVHLVALLRYVGCTATAPEVAERLGDELQVSAAFSDLDTRNLRAVTAAALRLEPGGPAVRLRRTASFLALAPSTIREHEAASCEVAALFASRLALPAVVSDALRGVFERWDGHGNPGLVRGEAIPEPARIVQLAGQLDLAARVAGADAAVEAIAPRAGRDLDPGLVALARGHRGELATALADEADVREVVDLEPRPVLELDDARLDAALAAIGVVADLKSASTRGRSSAVSARAEAAAKGAGFAAEEVQLARRAGWVQDIGRVAVPARVWDTRRPLTAVESEQVRLHPYYSERVLLRCAGLERVAAAAGAHHERADGSGYFRGTAHLDPIAAVLAAADVAESAPATRPDGPEDRLREEARSGALPTWAVDACLGTSRGVAPAAAPLRLTDREREVLELIARGATNRQVGSALHISPKTVNAHLEHLFGKLGVTTRGAAAFLALERGLLLPR